MPVMLVVFGRLVAQGILSGMRQIHPNIAKQNKRRIIKKPLKRELQNKIVRCGLQIRNSTNLLNQRGPRQTTMVKLRRNIGQGAKKIIKIKEGYQTISQSSLNDRINNSTG